MRRLWLAMAVWLGGSAPAQAEESGFVPSRGTLWNAISLHHWSADARYAGPFGADLNFRGFVDPDDPAASDPAAAPQIEPGDVVPIKLEVPGTRFSTTAVWYELRVVPLERFLVRGALPVYQRSAFRQAGATTITEGTGDLYASLGHQVTPTGGNVGTAFYLHGKFPTTSPLFDGFTIPLSEGQVDLGVESATTWALLPRLHVTGRLQFRHRFEVETRVGGATARVKPGDEVELGLEVGGEPLEGLWVKTGYQGLWATASENRSRQDDFRALEKRQIHRWGLGAYYRFGAWIAPELEGLAIDVKYRHPLGGVDYLKGPAYSLGLAHSLDWAAD